jgi:hypothetical protein
MDLGRDSRLHCGGVQSGTSTVEARRETRAAARRPGSEPARGLATRQEEGPDVSPNGRQY